MNRPKRSTAGNKLAQLLRGELQCDDIFYAGSLGIFEEDVENDEEFAKPESVDSESVSSVASSTDDKYTEDVDTDLCHQHKKRGKAIRTKKRRILLAHRKSNDILTDNETGHRSKSASTDGTCEAQLHTDGGQLTRFARERSSARKKLATYKDRISKPKTRKSSGRSIYRKLTLQEQLKEASITEQLNTASRLYFKECDNVQKFKVKKAHCGLRTDDTGCIGRVIYRSLIEDEPKCGDQSLAPTKSSNNLISFSTHEAFDAYFRLS